MMKIFVKQNFNITSVIATLCTFSCKTLIMTSLHFRDKMLDHVLRSCDLEVLISLANRENEVCSAVFPIAGSWWCLLRPNHFAFCLRRYVRDNLRCTGIISLIDRNPFPSRLFFFLSELLVLLVLVFAAQILSKDFWPLLKENTWGQIREFVTVCSYRIRYSRNILLRTEKSIEYVRVHTIFKTANTLEALSPYPLLDDTEFKYVLW